MTRKDFEAIAKVIHDHADRVGVFQEEVEDEVELMAVNMATYLYRTNPRFDRERFMRACGF